MLGQDVGALLGFEDEAVAAIEVDAAGGVPRLVLAVGDTALEAVGAGAAEGGVRGVEAEQGAEFDQEGLGVGALGLPGGRPAFDKGLDGVGDGAAPTMPGPCGTPLL